MTQKFVLDSHSARVVKHGDLETWIQRFEDNAIEAHNFDHDTHFFIAWCYQTQFGLELGSKRFLQALKQFTEHVGAAEKFHFTLTCFMLENMAKVTLKLRNNLASKDQLKTVEDSWKNFYEAILAFKQNWKSELQSSYSQQLIDSELAKQTFVRPDQDDTKWTLQNLESMSLSEESLTQAHAMTKADQ